MIMSFGVLVRNNDISWQFFHFFKILIFWVVRGGKKAKNGPKWKKIMSVVLHISRNIHHMIFICGTHVQNDNISRQFFHFFKILIFQVVRKVKGQKMTQNDKKLCLSCLMSQEPYIMQSSFMVNMCNRIISWGFFKFIPNFYFWGQ